MAKKVKQIPAKVGAKAKVGSGGKVEVVLNTTKVVKDASRGKYKPRKKTSKKQDASKNQKDAIQLLREQIELEKLQALQRQSIQPIQPSQRIPNRRTGGDINQFFRESKNTGKTEVISELAKEVKSLREELKKKDEKPVEKPKEEEESEFIRELKTTQNELTRERIRRGVAKTQEKLRQDDIQKRIEKLQEEEKEKERKDDLNRISSSTLRLGRNPPTGIQKDESGKITGLVLRPKPLSTAVIPRDEKLALLRGRRPRSQAINEAVRKEPNTRPTRRILPTPVPEPEPSPQRFVVGGAGGIEVPYSSQEELLQAYRNRPNQPKPLALQEETDRNIERQKKQRPLFLDNADSVKKITERQRPLFLDDADSVSKLFPVPSSGSVSVPDEEPLDIDIQKEPVREEETKQRRESFLQEVQSPEVSEPVLIGKLKEEARKLKELQETGDKAYQDRLQAEIKIQEDERVARDLIFQQKRREDFNQNKDKLDQSYELLKEKKQREKKKARDNLRKREQEEFLDETAGEIVRGATEQAFGQRREARREVGRQAVRNVFSNVMGGKALANEIITATQNIPRSSRNDRYSERETQERIGDLIHSDYTGTIGRFAYTEDEAREKDENQKFARDLKKQLSLSVPHIVQKNYTKEMKHRSERGVANRLQAQIIEDMDKAKQSGKYDGKELVSLKTQLDTLAQTLLNIKNIEQSKRDKRPNRPPRETAEERRFRIRKAQRDGGAERIIYSDEEDLNRP
jgi:hypothetical protein